MTNRLRIPVAVMIPVAGQNVLMRRRPGKGLLAGLWEFPGGKIRPGESALEAAVRELAEETGLTPLGPPETLLALSFDYPDRSLRIHFFRCESRASDPPGQWRWIPLHRMAEVPMPEANRSVVQLLSAGSGTRAVEPP